MADSALHISVVIPNFNYDEYVAAAIESALALEWPHVEVIVVDDGSTDRSRDVIARYADRIRIVHQQNSGQAAACAAGFLKSHGDVVIFLDSDDLLEPSVAREIASAWHARVSKVQFQMRTIDAAGRPIGTVLPQYHGVPTPRQVQRWATTTGAYPTPPGSGNAYSRWFLERIFPIEECCGKASDSYFLAAAPYLGDVITIAKPLVAYRIHGRNQGAFSRLDVSRFTRDVEFAMQRFAYARRMAETVGVDVPAQAINRSLSLMPYRLASLRLAPAQHPIVDDSAAAVLRDAICGVMAPQGVALQARLALLVWALAVVLSPLAWSRRLILWRFAPASRPNFVRGMLRGLRIAR